MLQERFSKLHEHTNTLRIVFPIVRLYSYAIYSNITLSGRIFMTYYTERHS